MWIGGKLSICLPLVIHNAMEKQEEEREMSSEGEKKEKEIKQDQHKEEQQQKAEGGGEKKEGEDKQIQDGAEQQEKVEEGRERKEGEDKQIQEKVEQQQKVEEGGEKKEAEDKQIQKKDEQQQQKAEEGGEKKEGDDKQIQEKVEQQGKLNEGGEEKDKDKQIRDKVEHQKQKLGEGGKKKREEKQVTKKTRPQQPQKKGGTKNKDQEKRKIEELQQGEEGVKDEVQDEEVQKMEEERQQQKEAEGTQMEGMYKQTDKRREARKKQEREKRKKKATKKKDSLETHTDRDKVGTQQHREEERGGEQQTQEWEGEDGRQRQQDEKEDKEKTLQHNSGEEDSPPLLRQEKESDWQKQRKKEQSEENKRHGDGKGKMKAIKEDKSQERSVQEEITQEEKEEQTFEAESQGRQMKYCHTTTQHRRPALKLLQIQGFSWRAMRDLVPLMVLLFGLLVAATPVPVSLNVEGWGRPLQGQNFSLVCVVSPPLAAHTSPDFSWYRDGTPLDSQTGRELSFRPLTKSDEGNYQCHLNSEDVKRVLLSSEFSLHVMVLENISLVAEVEVEEGQTVILNCSVHSDPTAFLTWRLGGKTLYSVRSNSDSLVLHNASQYHRQVVECEAYNNGLVLGFLDAYSLIRLKGTYEVVSTPYLAWKGDTVLHHRFALECIVGELPNQGVNVHLTYTWYKDHKVVEGQSDMILDFPSLRKEDKGLYTCTATNGNPRTTSLESKAMEVVVLIPPVLHIEPPDKVITQAAGETLTLTCEVTEAFPGVAPDGYRWSYLPSPGGQLRPLEGRESTLTLGPLTREDSGQYICQAWNYLDFDGLLPPGNASVTVDVMYLKDITLTSDLEVDEGDRMTLACLVDSKPAARLSWLVEGREVRHMTVNVDHYVVERAACSDTKTYTCRASNPRLPGLEISRSSQVLVHCLEKDEDLPQFSVSTSVPANNGAQVLAFSPSLALVVGIPVSISALVIVVTVVIVCF